MNCNFKIRPPTVSALKHLRFNGIRTFEQGQLIQSYITSKHLLHKLDKSLLKPLPIICSFQFESVYTGGRREKTRSHDYFTTHTELRYVQTQRGGEVTYHGPGQLVMYPILDLLDHNRMKSKCYIDLLQRSIKKVLGDIGVETVDSANTGVWVDEMTKISSIGVNIQRSITSHGLSINCDPDLKFFNEVDLTICGLPGTKQTSIREQTGKLVEMSDLDKLMVNAIAENLQITNITHQEINEEINELNINELNLYIN